MHVSSGMTRAFGATVSIDAEQLCVPIQCVDLDVKKQQQQYSTLGRIKVWIQTKVLVQIDSEVEQAIDPNRNQME